MIREPRLNLASGCDLIPGFANVDKVKMEGVDYVWDLEIFPWPVESDSVEEVICKHYIEHIPHDGFAKRLIRIINEATCFNDLKDRVGRIDLQTPSDGLILFMEEVYRVLAPFGHAKFVTPYYNSGIAWQDPTHVRAITETTYRYFNKKWREASHLEHYGIKCDFDFKLEGYDLHKDINYNSEDDKRFAMRCNTNVIINMYVELTKRP